MDKREDETDSQKSLDSNAENVPPTPPKIPQRNKKRAPDPPKTSSPPPPLPPKDSRARKSPPVRPPPPIPLMEETAMKPNPNRQVLVAASKNSRDRKPETRQRQPAAVVKLPETLGGDTRTHDEDPPVKIDSLQREKFEVLQHVLRQANNQNPAAVRHRQTASDNHPLLYQPNPTYARVVLARNAKISEFSPSSVSYPRWVERSGAGDPEINSRLVRRVFGGSSGLRQWKMANGKIPQQHHAVQRLTPSTAIAKSPTSTKTVVSSTSKSKPAVTRSGSLTSQGSFSSDSGNEGQQPKSVLKKVRRNRGLEPKKCVTFNALATVQVMEG